MIVRDKVRHGLQGHVNFWLETLAAAPLSSRQFEWRLAGRNSHYRDRENFCPLCALADTLASAKSERCRFRGAWKMAIREHIGDFGSLEDSALAQIAWWADHKSSVGRFLVEAACRGEFVPVPTNLIDNSSIYRG